MRALAILLLTTTVAAADTFPFEGKWRPVNPGDKIQAPCSETITQKEWRQKQPPVLAEPDIVCKITAVKKVNDDNYAVSKACKDSSGDGPSIYKVTTTITMNGIDSFKEAVPHSAQPGNYVRCKP